MPQPVNVPVIVGVTGKRKSRLDELGVSEAEIRTKLRRAFALLQDLAPRSPKILLCGMADGVDEIAARLVIEAVDEHDASRREFHNWSIVGLLPMPEEVFLDDFDAGAGECWWYRALDEKTRKAHIRLMTLKTLLKLPLPKSTPYTEAELRRIEGISNPARTAHYEQLGLVLAERSTVLIAVMPASEVPVRPGGTAQVVAHRLNGWRQDWPSGESRKIAGASREFVVPPPLATAGGNDVWLIPIGTGDVAAASADLCLLRKRDEADEAWPARVPEPKVLIAGGQSDKSAALSSCPLLRPIEAFNCRAARIVPRRPPSWDETIKTFPEEPEKWSPLAAAERLRGTLSDLQRRRKNSVRQTATQLGVIAALSIAVLELHAEVLKDRGDELWWQGGTVVYVILVGIALRVYHNARRRSFSAIAEDYRLIAEALRVQVIWWQIGLTARRERVDQHLLRYDSREFRLLRQGLATVLDAIQLSHGKLPESVPVDGLPEPVLRWIDNCDARSPGQIQYHRRTANERKRSYGVAESFAWSLFIIALGLAIWLGIDAFLEKHLHLLKPAMDWISHLTCPWLVPLFGSVGAAAVLTAVGFKNVDAPERMLRLPQILASLLAGLLIGTVIVSLFLIFQWEERWRESTLFLGTVVLLTIGGVIRYRTEKIATEAEAQGSSSAYLVYVRAKKVLDQIDLDYAANRINAEMARRRREKIIRDLGQFALVETEGWLRNHRERPLHPAMG